MESDDFTEHFIIRLTCPTLPCLTIALSPDPAQKLAKGQVTLSKILVCAVSAIFVWTIGVLPITTFLTCDSDSGLFPKQWKQR